jgi:hypothetical protein
LNTIASANANPGINAPSSSANLHSNVPSLTDPTQEICPVKYSQRNLQIQYDTRKQAKVIESLQNSPSLHAWYLGDFIECLRLVLLVPIMNLTDNNNVIACKCGHIILPDQQNSLHGLSCRLVAEEINERHNAIRDSIAGFVRKALKNECHVCIEKPIPTRVPNTPDKRADVLLTIGPNTYAIDASVTNNACPHNIKYGSTRHTGASANQRAKNKKAVWGHSMGPLYIQQSFVPFVIESGGYIQKDAIDFLDKIIGSPHLSHVPNHVMRLCKNTLMSKVLNIIASYNAYFIRASRRNITVTPINSLHQPTYPPISFTTPFDEADFGQDTPVPGLFRPPPPLPTNPFQDVAPLLSARAAPFVPSNLVLSTAHYPFIEDFLVFHM